MFLIFQEYIYIYRRIYIVIMTTLNSFSMLMDINMLLYSCNQNDSTRIANQVYWLNVQTFCQVWGWGEEART